MSTHRRKGAAFLGKGPNGRNLCFCGCGREVVRPRLNWFSDECVRAWQLINDPATIRAEVLKRDKGICAGCGIDCDRERRIANETFALWMWLARREAEQQFRSRQLAEPYPGAGQEYHNIHAWASRWVTEDIKARGWDLHGHTWEADHIIPVVEGGGQCGLDNYRTLCLPCHKKASAQLAKRRALARRRQIPLPLEAIA
jgi:5-methylcytosine-specific restriction protein A